ncbi:Toxoplasma gondii family A protein, partial [Toxoplasma gondii MAS]
MNLGPSGTLRVTDETAEAVYQPENNNGTDGTLTGPCLGRGSVETDKDSSGRTLSYTLANPPAQYWGESFSFCVRIKTVLATGSNSPTDPPTNPPSTHVSGCTTQKEIPLQRSMIPRCCLRILVPISLPL